MSSSDTTPWRELDIAPTSNRATIRRAYATRLKLLDPVKDRAGFERLRTAYEAALRGTRATMAPEPSDDVRPDTAELDAIAAIRAALAAGQTEQAFALFERMDAAQGLSLGAVDELANAFFVSAAGQPLPGETLRALVGRFGWDDATHPQWKRSPALVSSLDRRLAAERWYTDLQRRAVAQSNCWPVPATMVAQLLLGGPPRWWEGSGLVAWRLVLGGPLRELRTELKRLDEHWACVGDRFDSRRIRWCRRRLFRWRTTLVYVLVIAAVGPLDVLFGVPAGPGQLNVPLYLAVAICAALRFSHRRRRDD